MGAEPGIQPASHSVCSSSQRPDPTLVAALWKLLYSSTPTAVQLPGANRAACAATSSWQTAAPQLVTCSQSAKPPLQTAPCAKVPVISKPAHLCAPSALSPAPPAPPPAAAGCRPGPLAPPYRCLLLLDRPLSLRSSSWGSDPAWHAGLDTQVGLYSGDRPLKFRTARAGASRCQGTRVDQVEGREAARPLCRAVPAARKAAPIVRTLGNPGIKMEVGTMAGHGGRARCGSAAQAPRASRQSREWLHRALSISKTPVSIGRRTSSFA